jgi:hypothetical protein
MSSDVGCGIVHFDSRRQIARARDDDNELSVSFADVVGGGGKLIVPP